MFADRLFGPVRQWGFLVRDIDQAMKCWVEQLGVGPWWGYREVTVTSVFEGQESEVRMSVGFAYQHGVQIELIQQLNDVVSPYHAFYQTDQAQMLHQLAYFADDLDVALSRARANGMREVGKIRSANGSTVHYMDSPAMSGLVIELMQKDPDFVAEYERCAREAEAWNGEDPYRLITF